MWWLVLLIGVPFVLAALYGAVDSWRRLHGIRCVIGMIGGVLMAAGGGAFFSIALSSLGAIPATFEWPVGRADQIIRLPDGLQIVTHTPSGRMQVYDQSWRFLRAWSVDAGGGGFTARLTTIGLLEVWTARGQKRLVFDFDGRLVEKASYAPASYSDFREDGTPGYVPTPLPLWIFAHPFVAWGVGLAGMVMLGLSDPRRFKSKRATQQSAPLNGGPITP